jgi:hypothetical protein
VRTVRVKARDAASDVNPDAIAIFVVVRRGDDRSHRHLGKPADAAEGLLDLRGFDRELARVGDVLVAAAAAAAEVRASRLDSIERRFLDRKELGFRKNSFSVAPRAR